MAQDIYVLLVIYQKNGAGSAACQALREMGFQNVVMVDNSREEMGNAAFCKEAGWDYLSMEGNAGLPKAYNRGLVHIKRDAGMVVLLDDDTRLPLDYFEKLAAAKTACPEALIFLPTVFDKVGLLSPCRLKGYTIKRAARADDIREAELSGINSGMAADMTVFEHYAYDERYFIDFVDHAFLRDMRAQGAGICVFEAGLRQSFSGSETGDVAAAAVRYGFFKRDCKVFCGKSLRGRAAAWLIIKKRALGLLLRYRTGKVLKSGK